MEEKWNFYCPIHGKPLKDVEKVWEDKVCIEYIGKCSEDEHIVYIENRRYFYQENEVIITLT